MALHFGLSRIIEYGKDCVIYNKDQEFLASPFGARSLDKAA